MLYVLIILFIIQLVIIYSFHRLRKKILSCETDLMILNSKLEQLYRNYEVLKSDLENAIGRIE